MSTLIKICGITCAGDGLEAARLHVDFMGFIFYRPSKRYLEPSRAGEIVQAIRDRYGEAGPKIIGVFVDESPERVADVRSVAQLDGVQFAGDEPPHMVAAARPFRIRGLTTHTLDRLERYTAEAYLCDTHDPGQKGGTGRSYDYEILRPYLPRYPILIAGGLTPETVGPVVASLRPWGVDVSSSIEAGPGRKDHARMGAFVRAVRQADDGDFV